MVRATLRMRVGAGGEDAVAHFGGGGGGLVAAEFLEGDGGDFDVKADAVEEGAADLAEALLDLGASAAALMRGFAVVAAAAPIKIKI